MIFLIVNFDFRFGQEVKVKLGSLFCNIFWQLTICTMVQKLWIYLLRLLRYDFFKDIQLWLPVWTGSKGQIRVTFLSIFFDKQRSVQWCKNCEFTSCGCWDMIFLNIKLWFIVIRYLMTSSWRHKFCIIYLLCSKYNSQVSSSCDVCKYVFFCRQSIRRRRRRRKKKKN